MAILEPNQYEGKIVHQTSANRGKDDGLYLVKNGNRHWISDMFWIKQNNYKEEDIVLISSNDFYDIPENQNFLKGIVKVSIDGAIDEFGMILLGGTDQVARAIDEGGWQSFERPMPEVFFTIAKSYPGTIIDVGVNTGFYTFIGLSAHSKNRVIGFEPDPQVHAIFMDNIRLNEQFADRLKIEQSGLSEKTDKMTLYIPLKNHGLVETSSSLEKDFKDTHSETVEVEVTTLDNYLQLSSSLAAPVTLIKIDVEGHEKQVFIGAETTIQKMRPWIFVELLPRSDFQWFNDFINRHHYRDLRLRENGMVDASRVEYDPEAWNHLLVPVERYEAALSLLNGLNLFSISRL